MMLRSFSLGRALGIPLYLHWTFFLVPLWVGLGSLSQGLGSLLFAESVLLTVFGCVMLHELGHALMARFFGIATRDITLYPIGGVARLESAGTNPIQELCIALAGPAVNLFLFILLTPAVLFALLSMGPGDDLLTLSPAGLDPLSVLTSFLSSIWFCNGILLFFNLLPAFPMDGGRVLRALLSYPLGAMRATEVAAGLGLFVALGLAVLALLTGTPTLLLVALFVGFAGQMELRSLRRQESQRRQSQPPLGEAPGFEAGTGFTGFAWDRDARVWVRWQDGRPVEVYG